MYLRDALQEKNEQLFARFRVVERGALSLLEYSQGGAHINYTPHGLSHVSRVEQNYEWLLSRGDVDSFTAREIFCLLCATFLHDAFMIPRYLGDEPRARREHASEAARFLTEHSSELVLDAPECQAIGEIIKGHGVNDLKEVRVDMALQAELLDLRKLAACLSMADLCHADSSRAPEIVFKYLNMDEDSALHWRRHMGISGITRRADKIVMDAIVYSDSGKGQLRIMRSKFAPSYR